MKRLVAILIALLFLSSATDAFGLTTYLTRELKCPRCKMKIEKKNGCPCHKKKPTARPVINDPCGSDEGDFHITFDRFPSFVASAEILLTPAAPAFGLLSILDRTGINAETPHPPPRS